MYSALSTCGVSLTVHFNNKNSTYYIGEVYYTIVPKSAHDSILSLATLGDTTQIELLLFVCFVQVSQAMYTVVNKWGGGLTIHVNNKNSIYNIVEVYYTTAPESAHSSVPSLATLGDTTQIVLTWAVLHCPI